MFAKGRTGELASIMGIHGVGGSVRAFADAVRLVGGARTAVFKGMCLLENQPAWTMNGGFMEPGWTWHTIKAGDEAGHEHVIVTDCLSGRAVMLIPSQKMAMIIQLENSPARLNQRQSDNAEGLRNRIEQAQKGFDMSVRYIGESRIGGRKVAGYRTPADCAIWADVDSLLPLQIEYSMESSMGLLGSVVMTDIDFNEPLDTAKFNTDVPEGYAERTIQMDASVPDETDLIKFLRMWVDIVGVMFPRRLDIAAAAELMGVLAKADLIGSDEPREPYDPALQNLLRFYGTMLRAFSFVRALPRESNWGYAGCERTCHDASPVFWYCPDGCDMYRVIYGDLTVVNGVSAGLL